MKYKNYLSDLSKAFRTRLDGISFDYNFEAGDEFEYAICDVLRSFLPEKYGICRGFIVDEDGAGRGVGDDIIIYDQLRFPTLRGHRKNDYSRLENIPLEAVYAYIEAKHTLSPTTLDTALEQIKAIKKMCSSRKPTKLNEYDPFIDPVALTAEQNRNINTDKLPTRRNPIFSAIFSRYAKDDENHKDAVSITRMLEGKLDIDRFNHKYLPELVIAGCDVYSHIAIQEEDNIHPTVFLLENREIIYFTRQIEDLTYGFFLANLMSAIDWIYLGRMPWITMLNECMPED